MSIPKNMLRIGDICLMSAQSPLAWAIRLRTAGIKNMFNKKIANHAGIVWSIDNCNDPACLFIAEMEMPCIRSTSFMEYEKAGYWSSQIIMIRRHPIYDDSAKQRFLNERIRKDVIDAVDYDTKGILEYIWPRIEDRPDEFYCSEYVRHEIQMDGADFVTPGLEKGDDCSPSDIEFATNLQTIWTRF